MVNYFKAIFYYFTGKKHYLKEGEKMNPLHKTLLEMIRKRYLLFFKPNYVKKSLAERKGVCLQCGKCCRTMIKCPYLKERNVCTLYPNKLNKTCLDYPFDEKDQELSGLKGRCGYYWDPK